MTKMCMIVWYLVSTHEPAALLPPSHHLPCPQAEVTVMYPALPGIYGVVKPEEEGFEKVP
jgi:hypothetical protein